MSARLLTTEDAAEWEAALPAGRSAFGALGFARAQERAGFGEHRLLVAEAGAHRVAYPLRLRALAELPFEADTKARWDSGSPPYTGPLGEAPAPDEVLAALREQIAELLSEEGIVAEFAHLHPWKVADVLGPAEPDREVVWVDTTLDPERLWRESYSRACRKNVNRAEREGVVVREARGADDIREFHRIYTATMKRNDAAPSYFFDEVFFQAIFEEMPGNARFALAERNGQVVAAALYLHDDDDVFSYLGGADHAHQEVRPTNAVVHDTIGWARQTGKQRLILGGGYRPNDGIFCFKAGFSPHRATLSLVRRVHRQADYDALVAAWSRYTGQTPGPGYFPAYRALPRRAHPSAI